MSKDINLNAFNLINCDTDAIMVNKADGSFLSKEERHGLLNALNALFPDRIKFEDNGYFSRVVCVKAKNYIMQTEDGKIKYKGSAIKATSKETALKEFIKEIVQEMIDGTHQYLMVYNKYVKEILNITDITRWCSKKTITSNVMQGKRSNETKVKDAISNSDYVEGDKVYMYYLPDSTLSLAENFTGLYNKEKLLEKLYNTSKSFTHIDNKKVGVLAHIDFVNYKLKRSQKLLEEL